MGALLRVVVRVALVVGALYLLWRWWRGGKRRSGAPAAHTPSPPAVPVPMVACAHCGVHLPAQEALWNGAHPFCSAAHMQAGSRS
jgi:uncharacterized protein